MKSYQEKLEDTEIFLRRMGYGFIITKASGVMLLLGNIIAGLKGNNEIIEGTIASVFVIIGSHFAEKFTEKERFKNELKYMNSIRQH